MANLRKFQAGPGTVRIRGKTVNRSAALILYRCGECLGNLRKEGHGITCARGCPKKNFIHRDVARQIAERQKKNEEKVGEFYKIEEGVIIPTISPLESMGD